MEILNGGVTVYSCNCPPSSFGSGYEGWRWRRDCLGSGFGFLCFWCVFLFFSIHVSEMQQKVYSGDLGSSPGLSTVSS